jgi:hypothetical protein
VWIYFIGTGTITETERSSTVTASLTSPSSTLTTESTTETITATEIVTSIGVSTGQTSSTQTSSLSSIRISTQQSTLSTGGGQYLSAIFPMYRLSISFCTKTCIGSLLSEFIL